MFGITNWNKIEDRVLYTRFGLIHSLLTSIELEINKRYGLIHSLLTSFGD